MRKFVAYYRVSTKRQGKSGLGLEAQQEIVKKQLPTGSTVVAEYTEVESGSKNNRTVLAEALAHCKKDNATLIIAKLDRLSRDVEFIFNLKNSKVDFVCCDIPELSTLTLGIFATMAQYERERISQRIKDAFAAKKARGEVWNTNNNVTAETRLKAAQAIRTKARTDKAVTAVVDIIVLMKDAGATYRAIAARLNDRGYTTRQGAQWSSTTVMRVHKRATE
ncbi:resolvase [Pontibacter qinzhouensis]|uniref:Resolvase n=1 Tax=Pontibacter qinzhouensis TaxID=2603253 RepID=A0A5C8J0H7_9BACT|nr:recombinase family protein [Pontibacter qinzhouensis]TXK26542.1 resolvase [Pontibacter qinzhouensis]